MPTSLSPAAELIAVVIDFLEADILPEPNLSEDKRFNLRVALNLLATAERELRLGPAANAAEDDRLTALVGAEGSIKERNRRLARAIREGALAWGNPQLLDHLHRTLVDALKINNPKWLKAS